jgi:hypothetical protein
LDAETGLESTAADDGTGSAGRELSAVQAIDNNKADTIGLSFRFRTS